MSEPTAVTATAAVTTPITCNAGNATITVTAAGGTAPYTYSLDGVTFQAGNTFSVPAGTYSNITVKDANGCTAIAAALTVSEPTAVTATAAVTTPITCNAGNATITVTACGGTAP